MLLFQNILVMNVRHKGYRYTWKLDTFPPTAYHSFIVSYVWIFALHLVNMCAFLLLLVLGVIFIIPSFTILIYKLQFLYCCALYAEILGHKSINKTIIWRFIISMISSTNWYAKQNSSTISNNATYYTTLLKNNVNFSHWLLCYNIGIP